MQYLLSVRVDESAPPSTEQARLAAYEQGVRVNDAMQEAGVWVFGGTRRCCTRRRSRWSASRL